MIALLEKDGDKMFVRSWEVRMHCVFLAGLRPQVSGRRIASQGPILRD